MTLLRRASVLMILLSTLAFGQRTIDATGPVRERKREATTGSGGGIGRKLPLRVSIEARGPSDAEGRTIVEFTLTNSGKGPLAIPVSTNPGDLEPADAKASYTGTTLGLRVNSIKGQNTEILSGGADLFGSPAFPNTLVPLAPGESIRIITQVLLPKDQMGGTLFMAYAGLDTETIKTVGGQTSSELREIGVAFSGPYTARALFGAL